MTVLLGIGLGSPSPDAVYGFNTMIALGVLITGMILWRKMNKLNAEKDEYEHFFLLNNGDNCALERHMDSVEGTTLKIFFSQLTSVGLSTKFEALLMLSSMR